MCGTGNPIVSDSIDGEIDTSLSVEVARVNGNTVRYRLLEATTTPWHCHPDSDELIIVQSGSMEIETEHERCLLSAGDLFEIKAGVRHHMIVERTVAVLVIGATEAG